MTVELLHTAEIPTAKVLPVDDRPALGSWWWVVAKSGNTPDETEDVNVEKERNRKYDEPGRRWLGCVTEVGSNYVELQGVRLHWRVSLDGFPNHCTSCEDADSYINERVRGYHGNVRELMGEIHRVCALLGVSPRQALAESNAPTTALAIAHGEADINAHQKALVKAKTETLPELFKKVEHQHELMAMWMKAPLIPSNAELSEMQGSIGLIEKRIHTVELYAGLTENLEMIREGKPAPDDTKVSVFQRRHYMDEECLVDYQAGGMNFKKIEEFDSWLLKPQNLNRILPKARCIVSFRVRRSRKDYGQLNAFVAMEFEQADKWTFLYIRNGEQVWRMCTSIQFGERMFPDKEDSDLLGDKELWIAPEFKGHHNREFLITEYQREGWRLKYLADRAEYEQKQAEYKRALPIYKKACKEYEIAQAAHDKDYEAYRKLVSAWLDADETTRGDHPPWERESPKRPDHIFDPHFYGSDDWKHYEKLTPDHIYFDDAMKKIGEAAHEQNRIAVVLQGLLDRSTCLHPHPPWRIWTADGFMAGIEPIFDDEYALTPGDAPDFVAYLKQLAKSLKPGSYTIGQHKIWMTEVQEQEEIRRRNHGHGRYDREVSSHWTPTGNKGPGFIAKLVELNKRGAKFHWKRDAQRSTSKKWIPSATRAGWGRYERQYGNIEVNWYCKDPLNVLFNVSAYTPGDFHLFYDDPRTRANYLQWAPFLLRAEDWHHARKHERAELEAEELEHVDLDEEPEDTTDEDDDDE